MDMGTLDLYTAKLETTDYGQVFQKIIRKEGFSQNIIESYNDDVLRRIPQLIENSPPLETKVGKIYFKNVRILKPRWEVGGKVEDLTPQKSRERTIPYFGEIVGDVVHIKNNSGVVINGVMVGGEASEIPEIETDVNLGAVPIMLGSEKCHLYNKSPAEKMELYKECFNDPLGYFIIQSERVIVNQDQLRMLNFLIYPIGTKKVPGGVITCPTPQGSTQTEVLVGKYQRIQVAVQHMRQKIGGDGLALFAVFRLLGWSMENAMRWILFFIPEQYRVNAQYILQSSIEEYKVMSNQDDFDYLLETVFALRRKLPSSTNVTKDVIIPHMERDLLSHIDGKDQKLLHLAMYSARVIEYMMEVRKMDDRDSYSNKLVISPGSSIYSLFSKIWTNFLKEITDIRDDSRISSIVNRIKSKSTEIKEQLIKAFGPNAWGSKITRKKENITESLKRDTPLAVYSQIGKINIRQSRQSKIPEVRMPHPSQIGFICCYETPEGDTIGLVKNFAVTGQISLNRDPVSIINIIRNDSEIQKHFSYDAREDWYVITVNSIIQGWCDPVPTVNLLKKYRSQGLIGKDVCLFNNKNIRCVEIFCEGGRLVRPLFTISDGELNIDKKNLWNASIDELIANQCIEYIDAKEQEWLLICEKVDTIRMYNSLKRKLNELNKKSKSAKVKEDIENIKAELSEYVEYTHCEIDPVAMFGIAGNLVPQAHRQAGPRTSYQCVEENTLIMLKNGIQKPIKEILKDDIVLTVDPVTHEVTKTGISNHFIIDSNVKGGKVYKLTSEDNREIIATFDHPFLTNEGWVELEKIDKDIHTVAVFEINKQVTFVKIREIIEVESCMVADFTTDSENHSFIANGFVTHNCAMGRQALTQYHSNEQFRFDASYKMMHYPSKSLFQTDLQDTAGLNLMSNGQTLQVAIMAHPDNAEDGIILKEEAVKYGNRLDICKKMTTKMAALRNSGEDYIEEFAKPPIEPGQDYKYHAIDDNGIPRLDAYIRAPTNDRQGDCIIGKVRKYQKGTPTIPAGTIKNVSEFVGTGEEGYIDRVLITINQDKNMVVKVKIRQNRKYIPGDKIACLTSDHQVLTKNRGWINVTDVTLNDEVATLAPNHETQYYKPTAIHHSCYAGQMYKIKNDLIDTTITPNHRVYYSRDMKSWNFDTISNVAKLGIIFFKNRDGNVRIFQEEIEKIEYEGSVHCLTVENGVFLTRRDGKMYWTGNSRYSQKGTISRIIPARQLPRVASGPNKGMVPDIIINPHSQPSRMTINMILELLVSKAASIEGRYINATTFREFQNELNRAQNVLQDYGLDPGGKEDMEFPNGRPIRMKIFMAPCFYQALRHHVVDKIQMRSRKAVKPETRQPVSGRKNEGGLKVGEMERDALISHGSSALLRERLCDVSDVYNLPICKKCGVIAITNHVDKIYKCSLCEGSEIGVIRIPYVVKLLMFYLNAANIHLSFKVHEVMTETRFEEKFLI